ncbi:MULTISPECIES: ATP-binding protein [unclassified Oceanispirochaeta]|uniref:ATP-binding protein n=1 Tax=unclassified Oceanispirochaeta TaxID=2635722 RepID=UPI000E09B175|nr:MULTISPECIES: ATP-binding protein [unclassified Oceanispirochaeta]MBF9018279.1 response regulator [Oceanispirochaeta sp. M2]NPD74744.1 response regulator [Oceanispirochaeta sp. M1]RDG29413.1 response regulator [Oceanispirochaeta sp. M1]
MKRTLSVKTAVMAPFIVVFLLTLLVMGLILHNNYRWFSKEQGERIVSALMDSSQQKFHAMLHDPLTFNQLYTETIAQQKLFGSEKIEQVEEYTIRICNIILNDFPQISVVAFGNEQGNYTGIRLDHKNRILNLMLQDSRTDGTLRIYEGESTYSAILAEYEDYDPRVRPWYVPAKDLGRALWTEIYVNYDERMEATISSSLPVFNSSGQLEGVSIIDVKLEGISTFLLDQQKKAGGAFYITDARGQIVAHSDETPVVIPINTQPPSGEWHLAIDSRNEIIRETAEYLAAQPESREKTFEFEIQGRPYVGLQREMEEPAGHQWKMVIALPQSTYVETIQQQLTTSFAMIILVILFGLASGFFMMREVTRPIIQSAAAAHKFQLGTVGPELEDIGSSRFRETSELLESFSAMKSRLAKAFRETKNAEDELQRINRIQSLILDNSAVGIAFVRDRIFEWVNPRLSEMLGLPPDQVKGASTRIIYNSDEEFESRGREVYTALSKGSRYEFEINIHRRDGSEFDGRVVGRAVDSTHTQEGFIWIFEDITHRKQSEKEKLLLESQLRQAQKMEAIGQLAGGVAHDFNNILTALIGYGNLLEEELDRDSPEQAYAQEILAASERAAGLTKNLLAFSRKQVMELKLLNVNAMVTGMEKMLRWLITEDIELVTVSADRDLIIKADIVQMDQILLNLAVNARDSMPNGGRLTIETAISEFDDDFVRTHGFGEPGIYASLSVSDTGIGMDKETQARIFEPFYTTKDIGKGTGLGLSTVYGIVKQHNGYISVYSEPGIGTTIRVNLPMVQDSEEDNTALPITDLKGGNETILLAEDDIYSRKLVSLVLSGRGYSVVECVDGVDAVERYGALRDKIAMIILDVVMPRKNGMEAYNEIKAIKPDAKVLFVSGYTADIVLGKGFSDAETDFLSKPLSPSILLMKIREILDK